LILKDYPTLPMTKPRGTIKRFEVKWKSVLFPPLGVPMSAICLPSILGQPSASIADQNGLIGDARSLPQSDVGHVAIGRRPHHRLVQIPLGALKLRLELIDFGCRCCTSKARPESRSNNCVICARRKSESFNCASIALTRAS
jgi:hypothetical protein